MTTSPLRALILGALLTPLASADVLYVDAGLTTGLGDGSSWADAFQGDLGLSAALAAAVAGDEVWVAQGSYRPTGSGSRTASFPLKSGVAVYGSFLGGESDPGERPAFGVADSVLTGDLNGDDDTVGTSDNVFHVVTTGGANATAVLDGFVVRDGQADSGAANRDRGAGILCLGAVSPTIRNCRFVDNVSTFGGAAGYINSGGFPSFTDCSFEDGQGGSFGGAFDIAGGGPARFERCLFRGNTADRAGALEIFSTSGVVVVNCVFTGNTATGSGGGGAVWLGQGGNTQVRHCTIVGNTSLVNNVGGLRVQNAANVTVTNCILFDNVGPAGAQGPGNQVNAATNLNHSLVMGGFGGTGVGNIDGDPLFVDAGAGDLRLLAGSPVIDAGDNTAVPAGVVLDAASAPRFVDAPAVADTGVGPGPVVDMGAYEFQATPWIDLGQGLAGGSGTPTLELAGPLTGGSPVDVLLTGGAANASAFAVASLALLQAPFKGGTLVPDAEIVVPLTLDGSGAFALSFGWPVGVPAGVTTYYQFWITDAGGPAGFAASNGVSGTTP